MVAPAVTAHPEVVPELVASGPLTLSFVSCEIPETWLRPLAMGIRDG
jgi:hypothetical protein